MLFNSLNLALLLPIVFILYWFLFIKKFNQHNILLMLDSYFFYACRDWRFMFLLKKSTETSQCYHKWIDKIIRGEEIKDTYAKEKN